MIGTISEQVGFTTFLSFMHKNNLCLCMCAESGHRIPRKSKIGNSNRRRLLHIMCLSSVQGQDKEETMIGTYHVVCALSLVSVW